jgi:hypothetical protein
MAKASRLAGATSNIFLVFISDSSSTVGAGKTGLLFNTSSLVGYYKRSNGTAAVQITMATITTLGTFATGGFKEVDATNMPGIYEVHVPDAAFASGAKNVVIMYKGAANMAPCVLEIELTATDNQDAVRGGMTALPNANAGASGGLHILGANAFAVSYTAGVTFSNASGDAFVISSGGGNGNGMNVSGNGTGDGIKATGGATGNGLETIGGATSGDGVKSSATSGHGINSAGAGTAKHGIRAVGAAASGANAAGDGLNTTGGAASTTGGGTSGAGLRTTGGAGAASTNGAGEGVAAIGGGTTTVSGNDGIKSTGTGNGNGINAVLAGTGIPITGVFGETFGTGFTAKQTINIIAAACAGKATGLDTNAPVYRDLPDSKNVLTVTSDTSGNRSAITYNP